MLALDGGPPVRGERVPLAQDDWLLLALADAVTAHAGIRAAPISRPLFGVALELPEGADALLTARALDAERVTAGFLTFEGQAAVAAPADAAQVEQTAHAVAKVVHLLWEVHTAFIDRHSDACPLPAMGSRDAETAAVAVIAGVAALLSALPAWQERRGEEGELDAQVEEALGLLDELRG
jgi:hypothetical protein